MIFARLFLAIALLTATACGQAIQPVTRLRQLTGDVTITSPANGQVLRYNSTAGKWENVTPPTGTVTSVTGGTSGGVTITFASGTTTPTISTITLGAITPTTINGEYLRHAGGIALGQSALLANVSGTDNVALGALTLFGSTSGSQNVAIGSFAMPELTTGFQNTAIGYQAGLSATGSYSIYIGATAGQLDPAGSQFYLDTLNRGPDVAAGRTQSLLWGTFDTDPALQQLTINGQLEVQSTTRPFLPPRMTKAQRNAIAAPPTGGLVYQTDATPGLRVYNGANWMRYTETTDP